jgi:hypothetical protein
MNTIEKIQNYLVELHGCDSWAEFVDSQEMGNCQFIANAIADDFEEATAVFGEVEVDKPSVRNLKGNFKKRCLFTHHWVEIDGKIYDFSKGTLQDHIEWDDLYEVVPDEEAWRYHAITDCP